MPRDRKLTPVVTGDLCRDCGHEAISIVVNKYEPPPIAGIWDFPGFGTNCIRSPNWTWCSRFGYFEVYGEYRVRVEKYDRKTKPR